AHRPVTLGCNQCHDPHDGKDGNRLRKDVPDLCIGCHEDIGKKTHESLRKHGALENERSCLYCHDPHSANFSRQLKDVPKDLCLSCHDKAIVGVEGMLRDMESYLAENNYHHGPIREGDCGACHDPHGSDFPRILRMKYPGEFYAPFDLARYELCFSCHEKSLVLDQETDTLTGFRNGTTNLHFVHVNRPRKGRTCRACHDVHASTSPKHIVESVPFGSTWSYSLHYQKTPEGGTCGPACHKPRGYSRARPVLNK
ncbi:MAG: cytochrome c3 family protein, partial [Planctomycetota bacterium]